MQIILIKSAVLTGLIALAVAALVLSAQPRYQGTRAGHADADYLASPKCLACHTDHYASWARTHHSRMTQEAQPATVQGDFEHDNRLDYLGVRAQMERRGAGFFMTLHFADGRRQEYQIARTIGSRRIEQYLSQQNGQYIRLPLAYDLVNRRWMSLNGSFFYPDGENYFQHQAQWDANCVFCHNVKAQPQFNPQSRQFATEVNELGIACGACHGQTARHVEAAASPFQRTWWRLNDTPDKHVVNPAKLTAERSLMVCGHCHGQRVPQPTERIQEILAHGDPFNAGENLAGIYRPVSRDTKIGAYSFAARFWANGAPRLTAFEYQGILRSKCFTHGKESATQARLNCLTCHAMHAGDIRGMIQPENRSDKPCLQCHQQFAAPAALTQHTGHRAESTGSRCYDCHMPRVVYGVMAFHRTHEISVPEPQLTATQLVPNACNQCHLDKSVNWAIAASRHLWPQRFAHAQASNDEMFNQPEGLRALFAGDALTRALMAEALSGGGPMKPDLNWAAPYLLAAFSDNYPIVRYFAAHGSARWRNQARPSLDYLATESARQAALEQAWAGQPALRNQIAALAQFLRARRTNVDLEVGE